MPSLFLKLARTILFLSSPPPPRLDWGSLLNGGPCPTCLLMLLLGLNFLQRPLQPNTWPLCCQIVCWLVICKDLKALSQTIQGWTLPLFCDLFPHTDPFQQQHNFSQKLPIDTGRSRCHQMSTPLHVLLKGDPRLEGDVADDKADPPVCLQLY